MYKKIFFRIIISALLVLASVLLLFSNFKFCTITFQRYLAIEESFYGWDEPTTDLYKDSLRRMDEFSAEGDYQKWLVSSGDTYTGKIVRATVMIATLFVCVCSTYVCIGNIFGLFWRLTRDIRKCILRKKRATKKAA